jgi:hypothetical protein
MTDGLRNFDTAKAAGVLVIGALAVLALMRHNFADVSVHL